MCRIITVYAETPEGERHPDAPTAQHLEDALEKVGIDECSCYIGYKAGDKLGTNDIVAGTVFDGEAQRRILMEECIRPFLRTVAHGKIIIEVF